MTHMTVEEVNQADRGFREIELAAGNRAIGIPEKADRTVYLVRYEDATGAGVEGVYSSEADADQKAAYMQSHGSFAWVDEREVY